MNLEEGYRLSAELNDRATRAAADGNLPAAIELLQQAVQYQPQSAALLANLGVMLNQGNRAPEAVAVFLRALQRKADEPAIYNNLSNALIAVGDPDGAAIAAERSLELQPQQAEALNALGNALKEQGRLAAALAAYERGSRLRPDLTQLASNRLYAAHFLEGMTPTRLLAMHQQWAGSLPAIERVTPARRSIGRRDRLRIGYVSPDFRDHPVGRFSLPLVRGHQRARFKIYCYSNVVVHDGFTTAVAAAADRWREAVKLSDEELAEQIRADRIDILVDFSQHMRGNRLLMFARKPAPVQVSYLGYCSTTGLDAIDFRLTDPHLDPPDAARDAMYVERSIRLPRCYWCYDPPLSPRVSALPALAAGYVTFGCLNNFCKVTDHTLRLWRAILQELSTARLILHAGEGAHRRRVLDRIGVGDERVQFVGRLPHEQYLKLHHRIDIALDPTPCTGGTTTCDALWMGVPVVTLAGDLAVARSGLSILTNVGLVDLVGRDDEQYIGIATRLAGDLKHLNGLRQLLRLQMRRSPLLDRNRFVRDIEAAYQQMWNQS